MNWTTQFRMCTIHKTKYKLVGRQEMDWSALGKWGDSIGSQWWYRAHRQFNIFWINVMLFKSTYRQKTSVQFLLEMQPLVWKYPPSTTHHQTSNIQKYLKSKTQILASITKSSSMNSGTTITESVQPGLVLPSYLTKANANASFNLQRITVAETCPSSSSFIPAEPRRQQWKLSLSPVSLRDLLYQKHFSEVKNVKTKTSWDFLQPWTTCCEKKCSVIILA